MDNINTLLGLGLGPQDDMKALAQSLRHEQNVGDLWSGSTSNKMSTYGRDLSQRSGDAAKRGGVLRQTMERDANRKAERKAERQENRDYDATLRKQKMSDAKEMFDYKKPTGSTTGTGLKPTGALQKEYLGSIGLKKVIGELGADFDLLNDEQREELDQPLKDIAAENLLPADLGRYVSDNYIYTDSGVKKYRTKLARLESDFSKLASGLSVTGYEMKDRQKWSPYAVGINQEERANRLENLDSLLGSQQQNFERYYGETYSMPDEGQSTGGTPIAEEEMEQPEREFVTQKTINGTAYGQTEDGQWWEL